MQDPTYKRLFVLEKTTKCVPSSRAARRWTHVSTGPAPAGSQPGASLAGADRESVYEFVRRALVRLDYGEPVRRGNGRASSVGGGKRSAALRVEERFQLRDTRLRSPARGSLPPGPGRGGPVRKMLLIVAEKVHTRLRITESHPPALRP